MTVLLSFDLSTKSGSCHQANQVQRGPETSPGPWPWHPSHAGTSHAGTFSKGRTSTCESTECETLPSHEHPSWERLRAAPEVPGSRDTGWRGLSGICPRLGGMEARAAPREERCAPLTAPHSPSAGPSVPRSGKQLTLMWIVCARSPGKC